MIDNLTNGMIRLSEEISALRRNRAVLTGDLTVGRANLGSSIAEMISRFQSDRQQMGEKTRFDMAECVSNMKEAVTDLRQSVVGLRADFASDIKGAHAAWSGSHGRTHEAESETKRKKH